MPHVRFNILLVCLLAAGMAVVGCTDDSGTSTIVLVDDNDTVVQPEDSLGTEDVDAAQDGDAESHNAPDVQTGPETWTPPQAECYTHEECEVILGKPLGSPPFCLQARCTSSLKCRLVEMNEYCEDNDNDVCFLSQCMPGEEDHDLSGCVKLVDKGQKECDDGVPCTIDSCDPIEGCQYTSDSILCNDDDQCTKDWCNTVEGCTHADLNVDDSNPFTEDGCNPETGVWHTDMTSECELAEHCGIAPPCKQYICEYNGFQGYCTLLDAPLSECNDGDPCTVDSCDSTFGCVNTVKTCPDVDGNSCTVDTCMGGACIALPADCNDGEASTIDSCDPSFGCQNVTDPNYCEVDSDCGSEVNPCAPWFCDNHQCVQKEIVCDDGIDCTVDFCENGNCQVWENHDACDDGIYCNAYINSNPLMSQTGCVDECENSAQCDDGNDCTEEYCSYPDDSDFFDVTAGKVCITETPSWLNGDQCTTGSGITGTCQDGTCAECSYDWHCEDNDPCTEDICIPFPMTFGGGGGSSEEPTAGECLYNPLTIEYVECDGTSCTQGDSCVEGACIPGNEGCEDLANACEIGQCITYEWGQDCDFQPKPFNAPCVTDNDTAGKCKEWGTCQTVCENDTQCDDGNPCTIDECDVQFNSCAHDPDQDKWQCLFCNEDEQCDKRGVCVEGTNHFRLITTGACIGNMCELVPEEQACPYCDDTFNQEFGGKTAICQEQFLCEGQACVPPEPTFESDCGGDCADDYDITLDFCTADGCIYEPSAWCVDNGRYWNGQKCLGCIPDESCNDGNPCISEAICDESGWCQETFETSSPACQALDICNKTSQCQSGLCEFGRCIPLRSCTDHADCPGDLHRFCNQGVCSSCMPIQFGGIGNHPGCFSGEVCTPVQQASSPEWFDLTGDNIVTVYDCDVP